MKTTQISMQIVKNIGNYQSARYELTATLADGELPDFAPLKAIIEEQHARLFGGCTPPEKKEAKESVKDNPKKELKFDTSSSVTEFSRVCAAIDKGEADLDYVKKFYTLTPAAERFIIENILTKKNK